MSSSQIFAFKSEKGNVMIHTTTTIVATTTIITIITIIITICTLTAEAH